MASVQDCEQALQSLADRLAAVDPDLRSRYTVHRTVSCTVTDLEVVFHATLDHGGLGDLRWQAGCDNRGAQVRLATASDDLLALVSGSLSPPAAWAKGRLKIEASVLDLLKLRALL